MTGEGEPSAAPPIVLRRQVSERELLRLTPALNRGSRFANVAGAGLVVAAVVALLPPTDLPMSALTGLFAAALFSGWYCVPFAWLGLRFAGARVRLPWEAEIDGSGFRLTQGSSPMTIPWSSVRRVSLRQECVFVYCGYPRAFMLPARSFESGQLERFIALVPPATSLDKPDGATWRPIA